MTEETNISVTLDSDCISRLRGQDEYDLYWIEFETDWFAGGEAGECSICSKEITEGWLCLDGGEEVCSSHINLIESKDKQREVLIREWARNSEANIPRPSLKIM